MGMKLRQVTDSIHGTIYLSDLESELISTPYFYRLHDIYQSSTVYMTYPCNRTKRYEHSLGTMSLASRMLFSSVTNADSETRNDLFKKLKEFFLEIVGLVNKGGECEKLYFNKNEEAIAMLFDEIGISENENVISFIKGTIKSGEFNGTALDYYQYYPMECITDMEDNNLENIFLYRCLLQAVRIVALFHDVGHPPYSHIIEEVLQDLYNLVQTDSGINWDNAKTKTFRNCLTPFFTKESQSAFHCQRLLTNSSLIEAQPHERIGLGLLNYAIDDVVPQTIASIALDTAGSDSKLTHILYYITVVEFAFAILTEKNILFKSIHKIVDGILDADRLDYIVRDSQNSGVDWGKIPYGRIIDSAKLYHKKKDNTGNPLEESQQPFIIAYPQKVSDDIEDLILIRYKIFARINFHHRCIKTSMALKAATRYLAIDYLSNKKDSDCINPDICTLWKALDTKMGDKRIRIIQWNDSWLISALHNALVYLHISSKQVTAKKKLLKEDLEEILLNKKKYYTLLKRGRDNCSFVKAVFKKASITLDDIKNLTNEEYKKYYANKNHPVNMQNILSDPKSDAIDSLRRLNDAFNTLDLEALCNLIPLTGDNLKTVVEQALGKCDRLINSVAIINYGRGKNGLSRHGDILDGIYLYTNSDYILLDENVSLSPQIRAIEKNVPWLYVYFVPKEGSNMEQLTNDLLDLLATDVADRLSKRYEELFPGKSSVQ